MQQYYFLAYDSKMLHQRVTQEFLDSALAILEFHSLKEHGHNPVLWNSNGQEYNGNQWTDTQRR